MMSRGQSSQTDTVRKSQHSDRTWLKLKSYSHFPPNILTLLLSKSDLLWPRRTVNVKDAVRIITGKGRRHGEYAATCYFLLLLSYQKQCHSPVQLRLSISCIFRVVRATSYPILNFVTVSGSMLGEQIKEGDG